MASSSNNSSCCTPSSGSCSGPVSGWGASPVPHHQSTIHPHLVQPCIQSQYEPHTSQPCYNLQETQYSSLNETKSSQFPASYEQIQDVSGYVYCPPGWNEMRLRTGTDAAAISKIAMDTFTDIAYIKDKNAIQVIGESHDDVYKAQSLLNTLFSLPPVQPKKQWVRPDRPGDWGQCREAPNRGLRQMQSEPALNHNCAPWQVSRQPSGHKLSRNRKSYHQFDGTPSITEHGVYQYSTGSSTHHLQSNRFSAEPTHGFTTEPRNNSASVRRSAIPSGQWR
ncbi:hypothetical protein QVD99_006912 [Batrachochytrium dendrobatidis]|nr:hypothetical protein O5D80_007854 [Batrachochytrium dendrobatidis]KAK5666135.1 hypothetical protein QVD99_006912 [Batrachochytrium dendrobatidis]